MPVHIHARRQAVVELVGGAAGVVVGERRATRAAIPTSTCAAGGAAFLVCYRILNADSAFQIFECIFEVAEQALQARHASPASDEPEIEIVGVVRQGDVHGLPVQRDPQRIIAVEPRAVSFVRPGRLRDERRRLNSGFGEWIAVYLNGQDSPDRDIAGSGSPTTRSSCASTPTTSQSNSPCHQKNSAQT